MAIKLPKETIDELDRLVTVMMKENPEERERALTLLIEYERSGKIPVSVLLELAAEENAALSMYAISALGRNGSADAVKCLLGLAEKHREGNPLMLEFIIDALGVSKSAEAAPLLLDLIGIKSGLKSKLMEKLGRGKQQEEDAARTERLREHILLPVVRALEHIGDPKAVILMEPFLNHSDHLVRWHTIRAIVNAEVQEFNGRLKEMAKKDENELVRDMADLSLYKLSGDHQGLNN